jgi:hypothetical protein
MPHSEDQDTTIPVIDLSNPSDETAKKVLHAASTHGFLFIKNDGVTIPPADIDDMFKLASHQAASKPHQLTDASRVNSSIARVTTKQNTPSTPPKRAAPTAAG